jgi:hypothetical protein
MQEEPKKDELSHPRPTGGLDHVRLERQVVIEKITRLRAIRVDAADPGGGKKYRVGPVLVEPAIDRLLVAKLDRLAAGSQDLTILAGEAPHQGGTNHAAMTGNVDAFTAQIELHFVLTVLIAWIISASLGFEQSEIAFDHLAHEVGEPDLVMPA